MMPTNDINIDAYLKTTTIVRATIENKTALHIKTNNNTTTAHIKPYSSEDYYYCKGYYSDQDGYTRND